VLSLRERNLPVEAIMIVPLYVLLSVICVIDVEFVSITVNVLYLDGPDLNRCD
jgi:hypothetical protein